MEVRCSLRTLEVDFLDGFLDVGLVAEGVDGLDIVDFASK